MRISQNIHFTILIPRTLSHQQPAGLAGAASVMSKTRAIARKGLRCFGIRNGKWFLSTCLQYACFQVLWQTPWLFLLLYKYSLAQYKAINKEEYGWTPWIGKHNTPIRTEWNIPTHNQSSIEFFMLLISCIEKLIVVKFKCRFSIKSQLSGAKGFRIKKSNGKS